MAYSNFNTGYHLYGTSASTVSLPLGNDGGAILNSSVTPDPLLSGGTYCRQDTLQHATQSTGSSNYMVQQHKFLLTDPAYVDIAQNIAISQRVKVRIANDSIPSLNAAATTTTSHACSFAGLINYTNPGSTGSVTYNSTSFMSGYWLALERYVDVGTTGTVLTRLAIHAKNGYGSFTTIGAAKENTLVVCSGTYTTNTWYYIRFDVVPLTLHQKKLVAYTSSDDGVTWDEVGIVYINQSQTNYWRNAGSNGLVTYRSRYDYHATSKFQHFNAYFDDYSVHMHTL